MAVRAFTDLCGIFLLLQAATCRLYSSRHCFMWWLLLRALKCCTVPNEWNVIVTCCFQFVTKIRWRFCLPYPKAVVSMALQQMPIADCSNYCFHLLSTVLMCNRCLDLVWPCMLVLQLNLPLINKKAARVGLLQFPCYPLVIDLLKLFCRLLCEVCLPVKPRRKLDFLVWWVFLTCLPNYLPWMCLIHLQLLCSFKEFIIMAWTVIHLQANRNKGLIVCCTLNKPFFLYRIDPSEKEVKEIVFIILYICWAMHCTYYCCVVIILCDGHQMYSSPTEHSAWRFLYQVVLFFFFFNDDCEV